MRYVDFLGLIDLEIETVPVGVRDGVKKVFYQAWARTFPKDSITTFLENVKKIHQLLSENEEINFLEDYYIRSICFKVSERLIEKEGAI